MTGNVHNLNVKAIVLVGARDFGRCPLASSLPTALWPVMGRPVLERLLSNLADQGIRQVVVCCNGERQLLAESIKVDNRLQLEFYDELLPVGTAGCVRDAVAGKLDELLVVLPASITCPPEIDRLVTEHRRGQANLTVFLNPGVEGDGHTGQASDIYLCNSDVLQHVPEAGYSDIKEGLIPDLLSAGKIVKASKLQRDARSFKDRQEYLCAIESCIESVPKLCGDLESSLYNETRDVWVSGKAKIAPDARVFGPAVIMDDVIIESGAVVLGPAVLECNTSVSEGSVVVDSVLWSGVRVDRNCQIEGAVIDSGATIMKGRVVKNKAIACKSQHQSNSTKSYIGIRSLLTSIGSIGGTSGNTGNRAGVLTRELQSSLDKVGRKLPGWARVDKKTVLIFLGSISILAAFIWSYSQCILDLWSLWNESDEYSSGLLVPFMASYILWIRRKSIARFPIKHSGWGLLAFVLIQAFRFLGLFLNYSWPEKLSVVLSIAALTLLLFGWQYLRKICPILLFLCLMLPWPTPIKEHVGLTLQRYATSSAVFCLELIGYEIAREGNIIHIGNNVSVAVLEACNGLRMITAFIVISGLVVLLVNRKWWEKLIVLLSSIPIALLCNTIRLVVTAMFFTVLKGEFWEGVFHDFGGYAMMPLAIAAIVGELWLLTKLTSVPVGEDTIVITRQSH